MGALTEALNFSSSFSHLCWSCCWRAWFSSDILILLERIWDCTRARVCMHLNVLAAWRLTDCPCIKDFNLTNPLKARNALLAWETRSSSKNHFTYTAKCWQMDQRIYGCKSLNAGSLNRKECFFPKLPCILKKNVKGNLEICSTSWHKCRQSITQAWKTFSTKKGNQFITRSSAVKCNMLKFAQVEWNMYN
jgi:hypothetical protein